MEANKTNACTWFFHGAKQVTAIDSPWMRHQSIAG